MSQELRERRRESLVKAATLVFSEKGYHQASVADIIQQAGVARGTFYLYFEDKRQVFDSILDALLQKVQAAIRPIRMEVGAPSPLAQLREILRAVISVALEEREQTRILLDRAIGLDAESDARLTAFYDPLSARIEAAIRHGVTLGLVRPCAPQVAARCVLGMMKELISQASLNDSGEIELDEMLEEIISFALTGLLIADARAVIGRR